MENNTNPETNTEIVGGTVTDPTTPEVNTEPITMTPEELAAKLQSETDKTVAQAWKTAQAKWETEWTAKLETEKSEATKLAKMTAEQRKQAEFDKKVAEFEAREKEYESKALKSEAITQLATEKLPTEFADYVIGTTAEDTMAKINSFKETWNKAIESAVNERLKGNGTNVIKTNVIPGTVTKEQFAKMNLADRINLFNTDKELYDRLIKE